MSFSTTIPKIILQALVENAILHGILGRTQRKGSITIRSRIGGSSFGVKNVIERMRHYFGDTAQMVYRSVPGVGTEVDITFPITKEDEY